MPLVNIKEKKRELRARYKSCRVSCSPELKRKLDDILTERFLSLEEYKDCGVLFAFVSSAIECDTHEIIKSALASGKRVAVPKCGAAAGEMDFYLIESLDCLAVGAFGILEPNPRLCEKAEDFSSGLCLVPGLAFDLQGYRLGFGKGYYDRFLEQFGGITAGICYSKCITNELPRGAFDQSVDILITEKFINHAVR